MGIIKGKSTVSEASRTIVLLPSDIENWVDLAKRGLENALKAESFEVKELYVKQIKDFQEAYGEAMLELRTRKELQSLLWARGTTNDSPNSAGTA